MLTGEPVPVEVCPGSTVVGATINVGGRLVVRATRVGADTELAAIGRLVEQAQTGKAPVQRLADRVSAVFVPVVLGLAALTLAGWLVAGAGAAFAFEAAVAVLIIACPCALGLATPTALLVGTGRGAQLGILIKGPEVLEQTRRVDTVVLDKTGTVTAGRMHVAGLVPADDVDADELLRLTGALEAASEHPVGPGDRRRRRAAVPDDGSPPGDGLRERAGSGRPGTGGRAPSRRWAARLAPRAVGDDAADVARPRRAGRARDRRHGGGRRLGRSCARGRRGVRHRARHQRRSRRRAQGARAAPGPADR